jgi:hypothetical protein
MQPMSFDGIWRRLLARTVVAPVGKLEVRHVPASSMHDRKKQFTATVGF